jgi:regulator-associated protein of mTOR
MPISYPVLPDVSQHTLWYSFDAALDFVALQLPMVARGSTFQAGPFFDEQLCAAENMLAVPPYRPRAVDLPIALQVFMLLWYSGTFV